jgi:lipopolysaccharide exporter
VEGAAPAAHPTGGAALARTAGLGALWVLLAFAAARLLGFATNLVLARLLSPAEFGLVSFAMVAIGALTLLQDLGTPAAIVYGRRDVREVGGTALTINVAAAVLLFAALALASPAVGTLGGDEAIGPIATALAFGLVISALGSVQNALLVKELALRRKFLPDVVPLALSGAVSISLALAGFGAWSLVYGYLARAAATTALLWGLSRVRPWPQFNRSAAAELLGYGRHVSISSILGFATMNLDYLLIGYFLGPTELGLYTMAFVIAMLPSKIAAEIATKVVFPAYMRLVDGGTALARPFARVLAITCALSLPMAVALAVGAPTFVPLVLDEKWARIVPTLQVLAAFGFLQSIGYNFPAAYKAIGRPSALWKLNLLKLVLLGPAMLLVVHEGASAIAVVHVLSEAAVLPVYAALLMHYAGVPLWSRRWRFPLRQVNRF